MTLPPTRWQEALIPVVPVDDPCQPPTYAFRAGSRHAFRLSSAVGYALQTFAEEGSSSPTLDEEIAQELRLLRDLGFWRDLPGSGHGVRMRDRIIVGAHLVHGCNLACSYCNVQQGTYGERTATTMSPAVIDGTLALLTRLAAARPTASPMLVLFGGEPTLHWSAVETFAKGFRAEWPDAPAEIWLVTNGTMLTAERAEFLAQQQVLTVLSLDGPPAVHDQARHYADGRGSHEQVLRGLRHLEAAEAPHVIRATWSPERGDRLAVDAYLREIAPQALQVTVALDFYGDECAHESYRASVQEEWDSWQAAAPGGHAPPSSPISLDQVLRADWAPGTHCDAGIGGFSVTPSGQAFPCQVCVEKDVHGVGSVLSPDTLFDNLPAVQQALRIGDPGPACRDCPARSVCDGPCYLARPLTSPLPWCRVVRTEMEQALRAAAETPTHALAAKYRLGMVSEVDLRAFERGAALRALLWRLNRHLKPLAIAPGGPSISAEDPLNTVLGSTLRHAVSPSG